MLAEKFSASAKFPHVASTKAAGRRCSPETTGGYDPALVINA